VLALLLALGSGCRKPAPAAAPPDAGGLADPCGSATEALAAPGCALESEGASLEGVLSFPGDEDWYAVSLPARAGPRVRVRVLLASEAPLQVRVLAEGSGLPLALASGKAGGAPLDVLVRADARPLLVAVREAPGAPESEARGVLGYRLTASLAEDPDGREPDEDAPAALTPAVLPPEGAPDAGFQQLRGEGVLATADDTDAFSLPAREGQAVQVLLEAPASAHPGLLALALSGPDGGVLRRRVQEAPGAPVRLDTGLLRPGVAGALTARVERLAPDGGPGAERGDEAQRYTLLASLYDEADPNEGAAGNEGPATATPVLLAAPTGAVRSVTGRLGVPGDEDWYALRLAPLAEPSLLRYRLVPREGGGRFAPPEGLASRRLHVLSPVEAAADAPAAERCLARADVCPAPPPGTPATALALRAEACARADGALCLLSSRTEAAPLSTEAPLEGVVPVPPHPGRWPLLVVVRSQREDWADDRDYALELTWERDPDEAGRGGRSPGGEGERAVVLAPAGDGGTAEVALTGVLSYGQGPLPGGARGPHDYDAHGDEDVFRVQLPLPPPDAPPERALLVQWEVAHGADGGGAPVALQLALELCDAEGTGGTDGGTDGGACVPVTTDAAGAPLVLRERAEPARPWHLPEGPALPLTETEVVAGVTRVAVTPAACLCLEPRFVRAGRFRVRVSAASRASPAPARYSVQLGLSDAPQAYAVEGAPRTCPAPAPPSDGGVWAPGCRLTGR
jgi:hypothetical protein